MKVELESVEKTAYELGYKEGIEHNKIYGNKQISIIFLVDHITKIVLDMEATDEHLRIGQIKGILSILVNTLNDNS